MNNSALPSKKYSTATIIIAAVLVVAVLAVAGYLLAKNQTNQNANTASNINSSANINSNTSNANIAANTNVAVNTTTNTTPPVNGITNININSNVNDNPTDVWPTHDASSFTFRYPPDWQVFSLEDPKAGIVLRSPNYSPVTDAATAFRGEIYIRSLSNPSNLSAEDLFDTFSDTSRFWFGRYAHQDTQFGINTAIYFPPFREDGSSYDRSIILVPDGATLIELSYLFVSVDTVRPEFEAIAGTVRPTN